MNAHLCQKNALYIEDNIIAWRLSFFQYSEEFPCVNLVRCFFQSIIIPKIASLSISQSLPVDKTITPTQITHVIIAYFWPRIRIHEVLFIQILSIGDFSAIVGRHQGILIYSTQFEIVDHHRFAEYNWVFIPMDHEQCQLILNRVSYLFLLTHHCWKHRGDIGSPSLYDLFQTSISIFFSPWASNLLPCDRLGDGNDIIWYFGNKGHAGNDEHWFHQMLEGVPIAES